MSTPVSIKIPDSLLPIIEDMKTKHGKTRHATIIGMLRSYKTLREKYNQINQENQRLQRACLSDIKKARQRVAILTGSTVFIIMSLITVFIWLVMRSTG